MNAYPASNAAADARTQSARGGCVLTGGAFSLWRISHHRPLGVVWCGSFKPLTCSSLRALVVVRSLSSIWKSGTKKPPVLLVQKPAVAKKAKYVGNRGEVRAIVRGSCQVSTGARTDGVCTLRSPTGASGPTTKSIWRSRNRRWCGILDDRRVADCGRSSIKSNDTRRRASGCRIGTCCCGSGMATPMFSRRVYGRGGRGFHRIRRNTLLRSRLAIRHAARGIWQCMPRSWHSLLLSLLGVGGATSTVTPFLQRVIFTQLVKRNIVSWSGGLGFTGGQPGARCVRAGYFCTASLGFCRGRRNASQPRGYVITSTRSDARGVIVLNLNFPHFAGSGARLG